MEVFTIQKFLGENGINIWRKANGLDDTLLQPFREQNPMSKENTFQLDTIDMEVLRGTLISIVDTLAFDLHKEHKMTRCVTLK